MSNYLRNILNRHTQSKRFVAPRGKDIFESAPPAYIPNNQIITENTDVPNTKPTMPAPEPRKEGPPIRPAQPEQRDRLSERQQDDYAVLKHRLQPAQDSQPELLPEQRNEAKAVDSAVVRRIGIWKEAKRGNKQQVQHESEQELRPSIPGENLLNRLKADLHKEPIANQADGATSATTGLEPTQATYLNQVLLKTKDELKAPQLASFNKNTHVNNDVRLPSVDHAPTVVQQPTVKIHIGRIDIKAVKPSTPKAPKARAARQPDNSLQQFLNKRESK